MRPRDLGRARRRRSVVMGERPAGLRGAQAGDLIDLVAADGRSCTRSRSSRIAHRRRGRRHRAADDDRGGRRLGDHRPTPQVVIYGFPSRVALDAALADRGVSEPFRTRGFATAGIRPTPTAPRARPHQASCSASSRTRSSAPTASIQAARRGRRRTCRPVASSSARRSRSGRAATTGSSPTSRRRSPTWPRPVSPAPSTSTNTNTYGGCYYPRFNRHRRRVGFLSRHSWAMALDTNTVSNCQGCVPQMNCDVVRIFRRHDFAWGGNFLLPDGMHFEWVGERRDQMQLSVDVLPEPRSHGRRRRRAVAGAATRGRSLFVTDAPAMDARRTEPAP